MQTRPLGRTGHSSSVAIFGAFAISNSTQTEAEQLLDETILKGVNQIDVSPIYGSAEELLGPWLTRNRDHVFLASKTMERRHQEASAEFERSLQKLQVDAVDLFQLHSVTTFEELDQITSSGGAVELLTEARERGLTHYIGITSHGNESPGILLEAINRYDFDTVMFPLNFVQYANPIYRMYSESLLQQCKERHIGVMTIKAIAKAPWEDDNREFNTWYRPFTDENSIQECVDFVLSQEVTGLCTVGDPKLLPYVLRACKNTNPMTEDEQVDLINSTGQFSSIF